MFPECCWEGLSSLKCLSIQLNPCVPVWVPRALSAASAPLELRPVNCSPLGLSHAHPISLAPRFTAPPRAPRPTLLLESPWRLREGAAGCLILLVFLSVSVLCHPISCCLKMHYICVVHFKWFWMVASIRSPLLHLDPKYHCFSFFLAALHSLWDLTSPSRD